MRAHNLLESWHDQSRIAHVLEVSCGRGGGLCHMARRLPPRAQVIGLDFSGHAIEFCKKHDAEGTKLSFVRGHALRLPFKDGSFDVVVSVEASHAYGDDAAFWARSGACCTHGADSFLPITGPAGRFPYWSSWRAPLASPENCVISRQT